jgi:hypothetical protein
MARKAGSAGSARDLGEQKSPTKKLGGRKIEKKHSEKTTTENEGGGPGRVGEI